MNVIAKLVPPIGDKGASFQVMHLNEEQRRRLIVKMNEPEVMEARPFLQGDSGKWVMIEFWTDDRLTIDVASRALAESVGVELLYGPFTNEEVFGGHA